MRRIVLIRPAAGGGNIRFRGQKWFAVLQVSRQARIFCDQKAARMFGPVKERKTKREPFRSFGMEWLWRRASRAASPEEAGRERSACAIKAFCRILDCRAADGREDPPEGRKSAEGRCLSADFCQGSLLPRRLSAPPIPRAACGDKGQGAVSPGAPRPGGRCSRPTGGCSRRSRRRCPGPPRRRRGRGPGGSAGSWGQSPPSGCRRR